jgi:predicted PurR-regulated permease PerM
MRAAYVRAGSEHCVRMSVPPVEGSGTAESRPKRVEIVVSGATVLKAAFIALGVYLTIVASEVLLIIGLAFVFALGLDPLVGRFTRRGVGRGTASLLVVGLLFLAASVLVIWAAVPLWNEVRHLTDDLPGYVNELERQPVFKELNQNTDVTAKAEDLAKSIAGRIPEAATALLGITGALVGTVLSAVTLVFLTIFLLIGLPDLKRGALALLPPQEAARVDRLVNEVTETISYSLVGNLAISVIAGTVVGVVAVIIGAPFPIVLALIVGLFDLIPQVGSMIAAIIVVLITLAGSGAADAAIMLVVILIYQQIENYVIQPLVYRRAVSLSGFATIAVVLAGGALLGVIGAILAVPVAASIKVVVADLTAARRARMAALRAEPPNTGSAPA